MAFKIGLLGLGTVGTGVVEILSDRAGREPLLADVSLHRIGVRSLEKPRAVSLPEGVLTDDLEAIARDPEIAVVVELIGGLEPARSLMLTAIAAGKHVVTANKAVMARYGDEIYTAAQQAGVYVLLEAAVGGGIPILQPLKQTLSVNRIQRVAGIVNGTTNYILTEMTQAGAAFDTVLATAQELGYAEADPTADVDGFDAADKIAILASLAFGGRIRYEAIDCEGIRKVSAAEIRYADELGFTIKLLAIAQCDEHTQHRLQVRVQPTLVPKNHPLASVNGVFNAILVEGEPLGQVMFYGPGAGKGATASAVVADLANIIGLLEMADARTRHPLYSYSHPRECEIAPIEELVTRFYVRFFCGDQPGVIGHIGTCFGQNDVSLESIVQIDTKAGTAEVVVVTHDVREGNFRQALAEIRQLPELDNITIESILRVL